jgi:protein O-GlcNAc transferase
VIHGALLRGVFYEEPFLDYIRTLELGGAYADVGAFIGTHTIYFAKLCKAQRVYAFEPLTANLARLNRNLALNELTGSVTVVPVALASTKGSMQLTSGRVSEHVATERMDDVIREPVSIIKVDVEGMEPDVLRGAPRILLGDRPRVFAEAHTEQDVAEIVAVLRPLGFEATGRVFNASPTYEFAPIAATTWRRRLYLLLLRLARSGAASARKTIVPTGVRRSVLRRLRQ